MLPCSGRKRCGHMRLVHVAHGKPWDVCARREVRDAARVMGNTALFQQMEAAQAAIKRDVIFAASLYVS